MIYLIDTNVLLRGIQQSHDMYPHARKPVAVLNRQGNQLSLIAQNLIEFWTVATRPVTSNGLALSVPETAGHIKTFQQTFELLPDTADIFSEWERLVELHSVSGRQAHDTRLVAAMLVHRATHLLTFDTNDFKRYDEITVIDPVSVT